MSDLYEEYGLEQEGELGADPKLPTDKPKKVKKSGGWLGRIIAFVLGIVIALGSCAGIAFFIATQPTKNLVGFMGMDYESQVKNNIITEEYGEKTLLQLGQDALIAAAAKDLAGLDRIFPSVGVYVGELADKMRTQFGVDLDADEMLATHMDMLPEYIGGAFKNTPLGKLLQATKGDDLDPLLMEICYGEEGVDYEIVDGEVVMLGDAQAVTVQMLSEDSTAIIDKVSIASVVHPSGEDSIMLEVAYGKEGVTFVPVTDADGNILTDANGGAIVEMQPLFLNKDADGNFIDYNGNIVACEATAAANGYTKIKEYKKNSTEVKKTYYVKDDGNGNYYARKEANDNADEVLFDKITIGDMTTDSTMIIDNIYLKDALGIEFVPGQEDPHGVLLNLAYGTKGVDYRITGEGDNRQIEMINGATYRTIGDLRKKGNFLINEIELAEIMNENQDDSIVMYLLYGKKDVHYTINPAGEVEMKEQRIAVLDEDHVYNEYKEQYQKETDVNKGYVIDLDNLTYVDAHGEEYELEASSDVLSLPNGNATWYYLKQNGERTLYPKSTLGDLTGDENLASNLTTRLTVEDIFGDDVEDNRFLKHLKAETIESLPDAIGNLTVGEVFEEDMYIECQIYSGADYTTMQIDPESGEYIVLSAGDYYYEENGNYYRADSSKVLKGQWKYLLTENGNFDDSYKVAGDMNKLLDNMTANVDKATLYDLHNDGIIEFDKEMLTTGVKTTVAGTAIEGLPADADTLGDLTTDQMLKYLAAVLNATDGL